jgi:hypothetical protein
MMKKLFAVLAAFLLISGTLAAQAFPGSITGEKFGFDAVQTSSTEARYSAGRFGSYIDDFVGVNDYNGQTKTFLFLGGFGGSDDNVAITDPPTVGLSAGFAAALKSLYLGIYFGGDLIQGEGTDDGKTDDGTIRSRGIWNNYIAVLVGNLPFGALRLDLIMDGDEVSTTKTDRKKTSETGSGIMTALTWGNNLGKLSPRVSLGIQWPDHTFSKPQGPDEDATTNTYEGGSLAIKAGTGYTLNDTSSLSADLILDFGFHEERTVNKSPDYKYSRNGPFLGFIDVGYSKKLALGDKLALGIKPNLTVGLKIHDPNDNDDGDKTDTAAQTTFETKIGLDAGLEFKAFKKFTFYTGASLNIFDWVAWGVSGGDPKGGGGSWQISGIGFEAGTPTDTFYKGESKNHLGVGLVFAPDEHLSIGCGLNALLDKFFVVDLEEMQIRAGDLWNSFRDENWLGNFWSTGTTIDLTVSYTF